MQTFLLRDLCIDLLIGGLTYLKLQCWGSSLEGIEDIWVGTELFVFRARARGAAFSRTEMHCLLVAPSHFLACRHTWLPYLSLYQPG